MVIINNVINNRLTPKKRGSKKKRAPRREDICIPLSHGF
jgi:hypothetical protein